MADELPLSVDDLQRLPAARWPTLLLIPSRSLRLLELGFAVEASWQAAHEQGPPPPTDRTPTRLVVWRKGVAVRHRAVTAEEGGALAALGGEGRTLGQLCALLSADGRSLAASAQRAAGLLARRVAAQLLVLPAELAALGQGD